MALIQKAFSDIITFSRSSNATRVGPTGVLEYAPHNLVTYSQQFDNAAWTKTSCTATANSSAAPDGTVTADNITTSAATSSVSNSVAITANTQTYIQSLYVKFVSGYANFRLRVALVGGTAQAVYLSFNAQTGVFVASDGAYTITSVGNGWYRISITIANNGTNTTFAYQVYPTDDVSSTNEMALWGAQLAVGPYALDYVPTTSAAVYGPRFDYDGSGVTIVEPVSRNLLTYSEDFGNAAWNKNNATVSTNTTISPDGQTTADTLTEDTSVSEHFTNQQTSKTATNIQYTFSAYVKRGTSGTRNVSVAITDGTTGGYEAVFDPDDGAILIAARGIATTTGWTAGAATATNAGNGWWRFAFTVTTNTSTRADGILYLVDGTTNSYTGNGSSNLFVWGAQLEVGSTATAYMVSGASNGFRAVPVVSGSATPKGLLVEEQRQNLVTYSEQFDNAAWGKTNCSVTANAVAAPDGTVTADKITETATSAPHQFNPSPVVALNTVYTLSIYAKAAERNWVILNIFTGTDSCWTWFNVSTGVVGTVGAGASAAIQSVGNGWFRCSISILTASSGTPNVAYWIADADGSINYTGVAGYGIYAWGAQLEANASFSTSYIPTLASAVTRSADVASVNTLSPWHNSVEGTLYAEGNFIAPTSSSSKGIATLVDNSAGNDSISIFGISSSNVKQEVLVGSASQASFTLGYSSNIKAATAYKANDTNAAVNGTTGTTDTSCTVPTVAKLQLGGIYNGTSFQLNGWLRRVAFYPRRLQNAELAALTA